MLRRKLWRDLLQNKIQFLSIFLMAFLGIYVFVGIDSEVTGLTQTEYAYYEQTNLADLWVQGKIFSPEDVKRVADIEGVVSACRRLQTDGHADLLDEPDMQMNFLEEGTISEMYLWEGTAYEPGCSGVYIDKDFAQKRGLHVGDSLSLKLDNTSFTEQIRGIVYHPEYVYYLTDPSVMMPSYGNYGYCFLDLKEYPLENPRCNQLLVDVQGIDNATEVTQKEQALEQAMAGQIRRVLDEETLVVSGKKDQSSYATFQSEMLQHKSMAFAFPIVFVLISIMGIITTMTRLMEKQRIQIGTLKALGLSTKDVLIHYVSYGVTLSFTGAIAGAVAGYCTLPDFIIQMFTATYLMPGMKKGFSPMSFAMILLMITSSAGISLYACHKQCRLIPAEALRPAKPKIKKQSFLEKTALWQKLAFDVKWNLRDILRNKVRSCMGILGVMGCSMLLLASFGCLDSIDYVTKWMYGELNTARTKIAYSETAEYEQISDYTQKYHGQAVESLSITLANGSLSKTGVLTVLDRGNYLHYQDEKNQPILLEKDGIAMSYKMSQLLDLQAGDSVSWSIMGDDRAYETKITQIYRTPSDQGLTMYRKTFEELDQKFVPTYTLTNFAVQGSLSEREEIDSVQGTADMLDSMNQMMEMMYMMAAILIIAAVVLALVVLYNLGVLSMVEKRREMATLKVLGLSTERVRGILQMQNIWVTALGIVAGFPAGFAILGMMFGDMPESMDYMVKVYPKSYLYTILGTACISLTVNRILSRGVKQIDMIEALKGQE